jgi:putative phage-type endonuclease
MNEKVKRLLELELPEQRTEAWYLQRLKRLTASEVSSCLFKTENVCKRYIEKYNIKMKFNPNIGINPYEKLEDYIIKKCKSSYELVPFPNSDATLWGKKYEPVATRLYTLKTGQKVHEFGLVPHHSLEWLAASPDGITNDGTMLEIKCPMSRKIDTSIPPFYYWIQTQIQLETCDLDKCDFFECEIKEISEKEFFDLDETKDYGIILKYPQTQEQIKEKADFQLIYPPDTDFTKDEWIDWANKTNPGNLIKIYYIISKWNITTIDRDQEWFNDVKEELKNVWNKIILFQNNRTLLDDYIKSIENIKNREFVEKFSSTFCLISTHDTESVKSYLDDVDDVDDVDVKCLI